MQDNVVNKEICVEVINALDVREKAIEILEKIANSMYNRIPNNPSIKWFSREEVDILENELNEICENLILKIHCDNESE